MKFSNYKLTCSFLLLLLLCSACIKELNFEPGKLDNLLVIYGVFSDQPGKHIFRVTRTNAFEQQVDGDPVSGAKLYVLDSRAQKHPFVELTPGTYRFQDTLFRAVAGETYQLEVELPDGAHYRSDVEVMPAPVRMDSVYPSVTVKDFDQTFILNADVNIPADPNGVYLRWDVSRVWRRTSIDFGTLFLDYFRFPSYPICYMTEDPEPNSIRIFGNKRRDAFTLREQPLLSIAADDKFYERNAFEVIQYRISAKAHEYWSNIDRVGNPAGTIFDVPPASVRGNIYNVENPKERILGYFEVAAVDTAYTYSDRSIFRYSINDPCRRDFTNPAWVNTYGFDPECAYCTNIKGHSLKVPKFW
ncbi:MAG: DUF4249 domain-containing protein [Haliscomenobacter sp.]|uniref:DUF4249 domain-containing protein n=1 Tax=Haliscomenobacter sp. TaxID=2717303 RepID=UPI0029B7B5C1|nr:DUF4249 domain-containing protein [Haliscomenobacter sp.]MDX2072592.1 DUF4249 domain-containing protein [Haliscomenobacter sp.]